MIKYIMFKEVQTEQKIHKANLSSPAEPKKGVGYRLAPPYERKRMLTVPDICTRRVK